MELITIDLNHLLLIVMLILFVTAGKGIYDMIKWEKSHGRPEGWNEYLKVRRLASHSLTILILLFGIVIGVNI